MLFSDWGNTNELRNYPLDDLATKRDDRGNELPDDLLADVNLWIPESAGPYVFVSSAAVTSKLVTVTFAAIDRPIQPVGGPTPAGTPVPLCSLSLVKPVDIFKNYPVEPIYPGVGGWVMFGGAAAEQTDLSLRFNNPDASMLVPKAARYYHDIPVTSMSKYGSATKLTGLVKLTAGRNLEVVGEHRWIDGEFKRVVVIRMNTDIETQTLLKSFAGDCNGRPDDNSCPKGVINQINGVQADCDGNITVEVRGELPWGAVISDQYEDGLGFQYPLGLTDICVDTLKIRDVVDLCEPSESSAGPVPPSSSLSSASSESPGSESSQPGDCPDIPGDYSEDFSVQDKCFTRQSGDWYLSGGQYHGSNHDGRGLSLLEGSHSKGRCLRTDIGVLAAPLWQSYFVFCYQNSLNFWYIKLDANRQQIMIGRVKGGLEQDAVDISEPINLGTLYDIKIHVSDTGIQSGTITLWVDDVLRTSLTVGNSLYDGEVGYGTRRSSGIYDNLDIVLGSCP